MSKAKTIIVGFVIGYVLIRLVFVVLAVVAAVPGLASLIRGVRELGLPTQLVYPALIHYTPIFVTAFLVGWAAYRVLGGFSVRLFVALALPWLLMDGFVCLEFAEESLLDCWKNSDAVSFVLGVVLVPAALLLAGWVQRPPPSLNISVDTDAKGRPPAAPAPTLWRRSLLR